MTFVGGALAVALLATGAAWILREPDAPAPLPAEAGPRVVAEASPADAPVTQPPSVGPRASAPAPAPPLASAPAPRGAPATPDPEPTDVPARDANPKPARPRRPRERGDREAPPAIHRWDRDELVVSTPEQWPDLRHSPVLAFRDEAPGADVARLSGVYAGVFAFAHPDGERRLEATLALHFRARWRARGDVWLAVVDSVFLDPRDGVWRQVTGKERDDFNSSNHYEAFFQPDTGFFSLRFAWESFPAWVWSLVSKPSSLSQIEIVASIPPGDGPVAAFSGRITVWPKPAPWLGWFELNRIADE